MTASAVPLEEALALSPDHYADPAWLEVERRAVFARSWQLVGHAGDLAASGDHVVGTIADVPILIVRDEAGTLQGFLNICQHRAGPIATCNGRAAKRLRCAYHGWLYDLQGQLRVAADMGEARGFNVNDIRLSPIAVRTWQGLVFACLDDAAPPFDDVIAGIAARIAPIDLRDLKFHRRVVYTVACNWKIYVDNYLEGYHVPYIHPDLTQVLDYSAYQTEVFDWYSLQHSPVRQTDGAYAGSDMFYYFLYPNTMLNIYAGRMQTNRVLPDGADRCLVEFDYYYDAANVHRAEMDIAFTDQIQAEDAGICAHVQRALVSGRYQPGRLSPKREAGVWHFQNLLRRAYRASGHAPL